MTIAELKNLAQQIKLANLTAENSAVRVGSLFEYLVNYIAQLEIAESPNGGASAYEIYVATTTDNPVLSETDWIKSLYGHDGSVVTLGSNGNWFIDGVDTGVKAQPENPVPVMQYYNGHKKCAEAYTGSIEDIDPDYHLCDGTDVPGYGVVPDLRGMFIVGLDPRTSDVPTSNPGMVENYGAIGNTGGQSFVSLTIDQLPKHSFKTVIAGNNSESPLRNNNDASIVDIRDDRSDGNSDYSLDGKVGTPTLGKTNTVGDDKPHENRPTYFVVAWIIRVKPLVISGVGNGIESIVAGTNVTIDVTDPKKPVINVPVVNGTNGRGIASRVLTSSIGLVDTYTTTYTDGTTDTYTVTNGTNGSSTEILGYALSDQESNISVGIKIKDTIPYNCTLTSILLSLSEAPTGSVFQANVKKNGTSIFTTKITIDVNELDNLTAATPYTLVTTPTLFSVGDRIEISIDAVGGVNTGKGAIIKFNLIKT